MIDCVARGASVASVPLRRRCFAAGVESAQQLATINRQYSRN